MQRYRPLIVILIPFLLILMGVLTGLVQTALAQGEETPTPTITVTGTPPYFYLGEEYYQEVVKPGGYYHQWDVQSVDVPADQVLVGAVVYESGGEGGGYVGFSSAITPTPGDYDLWLDNSQNLSTPVNECLSRDYAGLYSADICATLAPYSTPAEGGNLSSDIALPGPAVVDSWLRVERYDEQSGFARWRPIFYGVPSPTPVPTVVPPGGYLYFGDCGYIGDCTMEQHVDSDYWFASEPYPKDFRRLWDNFFFDWLNNGNAACEDGFHGVGYGRGGRAAGHSAIEQLFYWPGGDMYWKASVRSNYSLFYEPDSYANILLTNLDGALIYLAEDRQVPRSWEWWLAENPPTVPAGMYRIHLDLGPSARVNQDIVYFDNVVVDTFPLDADCPVGQMVTPTVYMTPPWAQTETPTVTTTPPTATPTASPTPTVIPIDVQNCNFEQGESSWNFNWSSFVDDTGGPVGPHWANVSGNFPPGPMVSQLVSIPQTGWVYILAWTKGVFDYQLVNPTTGQEYAGYSSYYPEWDQAQSFTYIPAGTYRLELNRSYGSTVETGFDGISIGLNGFNYDSDCATTPTPGPSPTPTRTRTGTPPTPTITRTVTTTPMDTPSPTMGPSSTMWPTWTPRPSSTVRATSTITSAPTYPATWTPRPSDTHSPPDLTSTAQGTAIPSLTPRPSGTPWGTYTPGTPGTGTPLPGTGTPGVGTPDPYGDPGGPPPQQPPAGACASDCLRPEGWQMLYIPHWIDYGRCDMQRYVAWCPSHSATMEAIPTQFYGKEPFGTINELGQAIEGVRQLVNSYDWNNTGLPGQRDVPNPDMFTDPNTDDSPYWGGHISVFRGGTGFSDVCDFQLAAVVGPLLGRSMCFVFNVLRDMALMPWLQTIVNVVCIAVLVMYVWAKWIGQK